MELSGRHGNTAVARSRTNYPEKTGILHWMERVREEHSKASAELSTDRVHDLRVVLRRCILIADIMKGIDPGSHWKPMRKVARKLFTQLGPLRDSHALGEWIERLAADDTSTATLLEGLKEKHEKDVAEASEGLKQFDVKQWRAWGKVLASHYRHVASNRSACDSLGLEFWDRILDAHRRAQKNRSRVSYHRLRIALKKFRYAVENFLPSMYAGWAGDLKFLQDLLGEVHDMDVLEQIIRRDRRLSEENRAGWIEKLEKERNIRLQEFRARMSRKTSPLWIWREGLPTERELRSSGLARLSEWAYFVTPDFARVRRDARLALQIYDGFSNCRLISPGTIFEDRFILQAAALLQEVGRSKKGKAHHKQSYRMIRRVAPPGGWSQRDLTLVALIARFHRRALPRQDHKALKRYAPELRQSIILLAAILRFADAFHAKRYRAIRRLEVENSSGVIVVRAEGFPEKDPLASKLAVAKRLIEFVCHHPVQVLAPGARTVVPSVVPAVTRSDAA
jgi:CHAD domain-containing protein